MHRLCLDLGVLSPAVGLHGRGRHFSSLHLTAVCPPIPVDDGSEQDDWPIAGGTECARYEWTANADGEAACDCISATRVQRLEVKGASLASGSRDGACYRLRL